MAGDINLSALDGMSFSQPTTSGGLLSDFWGGVKGFLQEGIDIAGDFAGIKAQWDALDSNASGAYASQYQPTDEQTLANLNSEAKVAQASGTWIGGVPNGVVLLGGAALALGLIALMGRK